MVKNLKLNSGTINRLMGYSDQRSSYSIHSNVKIFENTKNSHGNDSYFVGSSDKLEEKSALQETNAKTYTQ